jgi:hypothetical protein
VSDQLLAEAAGYTTHNKHSIQIFLPSAGFKPAIPELQRPQTYAFDSTATRNSIEIIY